MLCKVLVVDVKTGEQKEEMRDLILVPDPAPVTGSSDNEKLLAYAKSKGWI